MDKKTLTMLVEGSPLALSLVGYWIVKLLYRKRKRKFVEVCLKIVTVIWVITLQAAVAHLIFMVGYDRGMSGQGETDAYVSFYRQVPYIGSDGIALYDSPLTYLGFLLALNAGWTYLPKGTKKKSDEAGTPD